MDRRTFLGAMAASPLIFGLRELSAQDATASPKWFAAALKVMKDKGRYGIVLVVPPIDPEQKQAGTALWELLDGEFPDAHEIFTGSVVVCMTPAMALATGLRKEGTKTRFLLDPDGTVVASDEIKIADLADHVKFSSSFQDFLYGEKRDRLKKWAEQKKAPEDVASALKSLESDDLAVRESAGATLKGKAGEFHALLVLTRSESASDEVRSRITSILEEHFKQADKETAGARLPFGTRIPKFVNAGCGSLMEAPENPADAGQMENVACGRGRIADRKVQIFLRFLSK